jgi:hypothetical protein
MRRLALFVPLLLALACAGLAAAAPAGAADRLTVRVLSTRPAMVTGGDVLLGLGQSGGGRTGSLERLSVTVDGKKADATSRPGEGRIEVLVRGLSNGRHRITVKSGTRSASVSVVNHPISGPVFSGPHRFLYCTVSATPPGPADEKDGCAAPTTTEWRDLTTAAGTKITVRLERGVINRSPYAVAFVDANRDGKPDDWNRRLVYEFGGGCGTSYSQGSELGTNVLDPELLAKGYAVSTANFNTFQTSCDDVLSAETTMMVKEHVIEEIGPPRFTIGSGASGGAIQQLLIAQNYPGLLDALSPVLAFPDAMSIAPGVTDCGLLEHYYKSDAAKGWTDEQKEAVNGQVSLGTCRLWVSSFLGNIDPTTGCDPRIPSGEIYNASSNPKGLRCTLQDYDKELFGVDARTGFARRPLDNTGVQYGLRALQDGKISVDQFLDLNERIGGYDIDGNPAARRMKANRDDVKRLYATGRINSGGGTLKKMPIITVNLYSDPNGDIHDRFRLFSIRERLKTNGKVDRNETIWTRKSNGDIVQALTGTAFQPVDLVTTLDEWLTKGKRPAAARDNCTDTSGKLISGDHVYDSGPCKDLYPIAGDARTAAGAPLRNDIVKCRTRPADGKGYGKAKFTKVQLKQLRKIFPDGVCDWNQKGVGQVPLAATWIDYGKGRFEAPGT